MLYRNLQPATWGVYHFILERKNHKTQRFFWKMKNIAEETGLSYMSVRRAEEELESAGAIQFVKRHAHCKEYKFIKKIPLSISKSDQPSMNNDSVHPRTMSLFTHEQSLLPSDTTQTRMNNSVESNQKVGEQYLLTNTINNNTNKDLQSYNFLVKKFGKEAVAVAIENVRKLNGEANDFWAYVHWSCKTGITPTNKNVRTTEQNEKRKKFDEEKAEAFRKEREQWKIENDNSDPELPNRLLADFLNTHKED